MSIETSGSLSAKRNSEKTRSHAGVCFARSCRSCEPSFRARETMVCSAPKSGANVGFGSNAGVPVHSDLATSFCLKPRPQGLHLAAHRLEVAHRKAVRKLGADRGE